MNKFYITKISGTYSELLEAYGVANTLNKIFQQLDIDDVDIVMRDGLSIYVIETSVDITPELISNLKYFQLFTYIKKDTSDNIDDKLDVFDYQVQKQLRDQRNKKVESAKKRFENNKNALRRELCRIDNVYSHEKPIAFNYDVLFQFSLPNNYPSLQKLFKNIEVNRENFSELIWTILQYYGTLGNSYMPKDKNINIPNSKVTNTQIIAPHQGKGLNGSKANGINAKNEESNWISNSMKISGAFSDMICHLVKVGENYDLKVLVPEYKEIDFGFKSQLMPKFKRISKGNTPIKIDVLNILELVEIILDHSFPKRRQITSIVAGLCSVYQKSLGRNNGVININYLGLPKFVNIGSKEENKEWKEIFDQQKQIIQSLKENRGATEGLKYYRDFISSSNLKAFYKFIFWYASYVSSELSKQNGYAILFTTDSINKILSNMDITGSLNEIITNKGFQSVAYAIRGGTVALQYTPKENRCYEVHYGFAQKLSIKSKSKENLAEFIASYIASYNAETARDYEKKSVKGAISKPTGDHSDGNKTEMKSANKATRKPVKVEELTEFFKLLDKYPSSLIGAMLAAYGFARHEKKKDEE